VAFQKRQRRVADRGAGNCRNEWLRPEPTRPETISWNIGIQHVFHNNYTFESRYVGTHSVHLSVQERLDEQPSGECLQRVAVVSDRPEPGHAERADKTAYDNAGNSNWQRAWPRRLA
jgi:hypothetical protein